MGSSTPTAQITGVRPGSVWLPRHQLEIDSLVLALLDHPEVESARATAQVRFQATPEFAVADAPATLQASVDNMLFSCLQIAVNLDPGRPGVVWTARLPYAVDGQNIPDTRHGGDNPDRIYRLIGVSPTHNYEISGQRHPTHPSSGQLYFETVRAPGLYGQPLGALHSTDIDVAVDGTFAFTADSTPPNGRRNHLQLPPEATHIVVRDTLEDWAQEIPNEIEVRLLDGPVRPQRSHDELAHDGAALFMQCVDRHLGMLQFCLREQPPNVLLAFERPVHWGMGGGLFAFNRFELGDDEALVLTLELLDAAYFNIAACDPWGASIAYDSHIPCLNNVQAQRNDDGRYTFVLSPRDPGVYNWLDTGGLCTGSVVARWDARAAAPIVDVGTDPDAGSGRAWAPETIVEAAVPDARVVKFSDVTALIPPGQARVTPEERTKLQTARRAESQVRMTGEVIGVP